MLSEEEKKAIERMYDLIYTCEVGIEKHGQYDDLFEKDKQAIETVLNLITRLEKENEEKDKQIELMAEYIYNTQIECNIYYKDKKEVKQYFENKAKGE